MPHLFSWIQSNPGDFGMLISTVVVIIVATIAAWHVGGFRRGLLALMLLAADARRKGKLGPIDGPQVAELIIGWAMSRLVPALPLILRPLFTTERIRSMLQKLWDWSLDYLDDGMFNGTRPTLPDDPAA